MIQFISFRKLIEGFWRQSLLNTVFGTSLLPLREIALGCQSDVDGVK